MPYKNIEDRRRNHREYELKNAEKVKEWAKKKREKSKEKMAPYYAQYQKNHRDLINKRKREKIKNNPEYRLKVLNATKLWRLNNPEKMALTKRKSMLKHKYGITLEEYQNLLTEQENKCAICKREIQLCVDHDHVTGKTRGLLCHACNRAIGLLKENEEILINAINYVNKYKAS